MEDAPELRTWQLLVLDSTGLVVGEEPAVGLRSVIQGPAIP